MNRSIQIKIKYFLDRVFGVLLCIALIPVFVIIAIAIKIDDGNAVFFRQKRPGFKGKPFTIWKFRTMVPDADSLLDEKGGVVDVNRITKVGKVLRYLSLDELPQLINIIRGDM